VPLTPAEFRANLAQRFAETAAEDDRAAEEARAKLPEAVRRIVAALGPRRIVLFGSLTKGFFRAAHSDVDLAVEGIGLGPPRELAASLRELFGRRVDMVDPALVSGFIQRAIAKGTVLFEPR
jgi:predicted nucleotidyltransferase